MLDGKTKMLEIANLVAPIGDDLRETLRVFRAEVDSDQSFIRDLCDHVGQYHGKQLRPALLLLTARACGGVTPDHHVLAAVVEMVHMATLVHDDVLDDADVRRGADTVNRLWGNERSILLGDYLFSHAYHLCSSLNSQFAARQIGATGVTLCEGEMMQVANRGNYDLDETLYYDIIHRKTASLIGTASALGAHYAGADPERVEKMRIFGESLGIAFQIVDDLLDITGSEAEVGKSVGRDVEKGKLTLALIHFLQTQSPAARSRMLETLNGDSPTRQQAVAAQLQGSDSLDYANQAATGHIQRALTQLEGLPESDARDGLQAMAEFVAARTF